MTHNIAKSFLLILTTTVFYSANSLPIQGVDNNPAVPLEWNPKERPSPRLQQVKSLIPNMEQNVKNDVQSIKNYFERVKPLLHCPKCRRQDESHHQPEDLDYWHAGLYYHDLIGQALAEDVQNEETNRPTAKGKSAALQSPQTQGLEGREKDLCSMADKSKDNNGCTVESTPKHTIRFMSCSSDFVRPGELGLFCEGEKLYCQIFGKVNLEIQVDESTQDAATSKGLRRNIFEKIIGVMNNDKNERMFGVAHEQEKEGQHDLAAVNYNDAFTRIEDSEQDALLQFISLCGYRTRNALVESDPHHNSQTSGYSGAIVAHFPGKAAIPAQIIKIFREEEKGLEEFLYSLMAFRLHPRHELKIVDIYDAVLCQNALSFIMEKARGKDIDSFMITNKIKKDEKNRRNVIRACAQYLGNFHVIQSERYTETYKGRYLGHTAEFFHSLSQNLIEEEKESKLFKLRSDDNREPEGIFLNSANIIQAFCKDKQKEAIKFINRTRKIFEKCAGDIYRALNAEDRDKEYWTTITHGDAHRRNFFYDHETTGIPEDSLERVTMIDYSSIMRTYESIGDPAEDIGRFLGSLWDWASESFENHPPKEGELLSEEDLLTVTEEEKKKNYDSMSALQKTFLDSYFEVISQKYHGLSIEKFKEIFLENCNFYQLRYYRAIFNSKTDRKKNKSKEILFNYWFKQMESHKSDLVKHIEDIIKQEDERKEKARSQLKWIPIQSADEIIHNLPNRVDSFIESAPHGESSNSSYLTQLFTQLQHSGTATLTSQGENAGLGGIGKTSLALEYAHESYHNRAYDLIWWLPSENSERSLKERYKEILQSVNPKLIQGDFSKADSLKGWKKLIERQISSEHKWLLIYDNARSSKSLEDMIPKKENIHVLITSRHYKEWELSSLLNLTPFSLEESIHYLLTVTGASDNLENRDIIRRVAEALDNLPLALSIAANYVKLVGGDAVTGGLFETFLEEFDKDPDARNPVADQPTLFKRLVGSTYNILEKELGKGSEIARCANNIMIWCSYLDPDFIPEDTFLNIEEDRERTKEALERLYSLSLIRKVQDHAFSVHRLIQKVIRGKQQEKAPLLKVMSNVEQLFHKELAGNKKLETLILLPHVLRLLENSEPSKSSEVEQSAELSEKKPRAPRYVDISSSDTYSLRWIGRILFDWYSHQEIFGEWEDVRLKKDKGFIKKLSPEIEGLLAIREGENSSDWPKQHPHPEIYNVVGLMHAAGRYGLKEDGNEALKYLKAAWNKGNGSSEAKFYKGVLYYNGGCIEKDNAKSKACFKKAAKKRNVHAMHNLGICYYEGKGVKEKNPKKAAEWLEEAAIEKYLPAMNTFGDLCYSGEGVEKKDPEKAKKLFKEAAKRGYAPAMNNMGRFYQNKAEEPYQVDKEKYYAKAMNWYTEAAKQRYPDALHNVGWFYERSKHYEEAMNLYKQAARQKHAAAMNNIGMLYYNGLGVNKDDGQAMHWFKKAVESGYADAIDNIKEIANHYLQEDTPQSSEKARKWFEIAANLGDSKIIDRIKEIGNSYLGIRSSSLQGVHERPITKNNETARKWFEIAAKLGDTDSMEKLACLYKKGKGKNNEQAKYWSKQALEKKTSNNK